MLFGFEDRYAMFDVTPVDNQFIQEYLPAARGDDVRVYLYGLMRCYHPEKEMSLERMAQELNLSAEEIARAYRYWERRGLVRRISDDPVQYEYLSLRQQAVLAPVNQLDPEYEAFAESLYSVFDNGRRLHGSEIRTCYDWVEELKLPPEAVLMLLKHMERKKGKNFTIQSAEQVALEMAGENIRTVEEAEEFLTRDQAIYQGTRAVLKRLGRRNPPSQDQLALYRKWITEWHFTPEAVEEACAETAKGDPSMGFLDGILRNIRERTVPGGEIGEREILRSREEAEGLRRVLKALGGGAVSEEGLQWYRGVTAAYPEEMILMAARECGRSEGRTEDVEKLLESWRQKGILTAGDAENYIRRFRAQSELLLELRKIWGMKSRLGAKDREMAGAWENELGFSREAILLAAESACGKDRPMLYLDKILRDYANRGIREKKQLAAAMAEWRKQAGGVRGDAPARPAKTVTAQQYSQRDYSGAGENMDEVLERLRRGELLHARGSDEPGASGSGGSAAAE